VTFVLEVALDWVLERQGHCDTVLVLDGRSVAIRDLMQRKMARARHVNYFWVVYQPKRERGSRKVVFGSNNRGVGWASICVARTNVTTQMCKATSIKKMTPRRCLDAR
jgi:hypothetical protein